MGAFREYPDALEASLQAVYGIRLSQHDYGVLELANRVAHLPPGCALWRAAGGPLAWTDEIHMLAGIEHGIRVLAWYKTEDGKNGRKPPKREEPPGHTAAEQDADTSAKAEAWAARQQRAASPKRS